MRWKSESVFVARPALAAGVVSLAALGTASSALAHDGDVGLENNAGRLATILVSGEPPSQTFLDPERVFGAELLFSVDDNAVLTDEPHFATDDSSVLGLSINFTLTKSLRVWNDTLGVFEATSQTMTVGNPGLGLGNVTTPPTDSLVAAATIPSFLAHNPVYLWTLDGATASTGEGVYLVEGVFANPGGSLQSSLPVWFVFNYGLDEDVHDRAIDYAADVLVPAPGAAGLILAMVGGVAVRRRRK